MTSLGLGAGVLFRTNEKKNYRRPATQAADTITYFPSSIKTIFIGAALQGRGFTQLDFFCFSFCASQLNPYLCIRASKIFISSLNFHNIFLKEKKKHIQTWLESHQNDCVFILDINGPQSLIKTVVQSLRVIICKIHERFF